MQFPVVKGSFTTVKVPRVTAPNISEINISGYLIKQQESKGCLKEVWRDWGYRLGE